VFSGVIVHFLTCVLRVLLDSVTKPLTLSKTLETDEVCFHELRQSGLRLCRVVSALFVPSEQSRLHAALLARLRIHWASHRVCQKS